MLEAISAVAMNTKIRAGFFNLIGTLKEARMGFYRNGRYEPVHIREPVEIVSCMGNISLNGEEEVVAHAHISVSNEEGEVLGGHLLPGCIVSVTAEMVLVEAVNANLRRKFDEKSNLYLWSLDTGSTTA